MNSISREKILKLINEIKDIVKKEIDVSVYLEGDSAKNNTERDEEILDFQGVSNGFLSAITYVITGYEIEVIGEVEELFHCPCCRYKTLTEIYNVDEGTGYDICPHCNWEDDGTIDINLYSSVNRGSIVDCRNKIHENSNIYYINKWLN